FGHGFRTCLGKDISLMEISKVVPHILRKYDFHCADPNAELQCEYVCFVKPKNMMVTSSDEKPDAFAFCSKRECLHMMCLNKGVMLIPKNKGKRSRNLYGGKAFSLTFQPCLRKDVESIIFLILLS
ncbi:hypothetical protein K469DRAFT_588037, partial [Zopfia rhizophila CBS 207.26]